MRIACLGEALVDLVCERPVTGPTDVDAFVPHFGGALANVAVQAARLGADVGICGGVGDDPWGHWLEQQLREAGVDTGDFVLERGGRTPLALVTIDDRGEPSYAIYGSTTGLGLTPAAAKIAGAIERAGLIVLTSNTLLGEQERRLTMGARAQALAEHRKVVVDANLRPNRWADPAEMRRETLALLDGAFLAKMNLEEASFLTGETDPVRAAELLRRDVARNVVITSGARGAILRGENGVAREVPSHPVVVKNAAGAGDAVTGVLLAHLAASDGYAPRSTSRCRRRWTPPRASCSAGARPEPMTPSPKRPAKAVRRTGPQVRGRATVSRADWKVPSRDRVRRLRSRLQGIYGIPVERPHGDPIGELVLTVLSQSTNDRNRDIAYLSLTDRFRDWAAVRDAPVGDVEEAIRHGGISKVKSARIQAILEAIGDPVSLDHLATMPLSDAQDELCALPASAARPRPACSCSRSGWTTSPSTRTSRASARASASFARVPRSRSCTTRCSRSPRPAPRGSST